MSDAAATQWFDPDIDPAGPGEYRAALEPSDSLPTTRRWWNGRSWSNPYHTTYPKQLIERLRKELSPLRPFWTTS